MSEEGGMVSLTIRLTEAGMRFEHPARIPSDTSFSNFKAAVEEMFDQRLQLSFSHRGPLPRLEKRSSFSTATSPLQPGTSPSPQRKRPESGAAVPLSSQPSTPENGADVSRLLDKAVSPQVQASHVALNDTTWPIFLQGKKLVVRAWSVFPGQSLATVDPIRTGSRAYETREDRISRFVDGTESLPHGKRMQLLHKRLQKLESPPPQKPRGGARQLNLSRTLTAEQREAAITRLWYDAEQRSKVVTERQEEEDERLRQRMRVRVRKGKPEDRSEQEESFILRQQEAVERREGIRGGLEAEYEERVARITKAGAAPVLAPEEIDAAVSRLAKPRVETAAELRLREVKLLGKPADVKKLTQQELRARVDSLYTTALQKKHDKLKALREQNPPPETLFGGGKISPKRRAELLERLTGK
eukprot:TRINITY_DN9564_c0_g1_i1.p1 TRINITY_DN9564_c0_g1~~TRINITY_DN9564_c0_g1_i1.p1  ORF type:complete len:415 (+),score=116.59 TRINITY_DN9564_c0_g1_i1:98-1342(+)